MPGRSETSAFAQLAGHELLREEAAEGVYRYWLRKR